MHLLDRIFGVQPGLRCLTIFTKDGRHIDRWFRSTDDLLITAQSLERYAVDLYFSRSIYKAAGSRSNLAFGSTSTLALDLDIRPGKSKNYQSKEEALTALVAFVRAEKLPQPDIIWSGGGLHVYWTNPLESHEFGEAKRLAAALARCAQKHGLLADYACTNNLVGVLRIPGTRNRKYDAQYVTPILIGKPDPDQLYAGLRPYMEGVALDGRFAGMVQSARLPDIVIDSYDDTPADLRLIVRACRQMLVAAGSAEPIWRAGLTIARLCSGGDEMAKRWSAAGNYQTATRTVIKLKEITVQHGIKGMPSTCKHFDMVNPGVCGSCPHNGVIKSPIVLGRGQLVVPIPAPPIMEKTPCIEQGEYMTTQEEDDTSFEVVVYDPPGPLASAPAEAVYTTDMRFKRLNGMVMCGVKKEGEEDGYEWVPMFNGDAQIIARSRHNHGKGADGGVSYLWRIAPPNCEPLERHIVSADNSSLINQFAAQGLHYLLPRVNPRIGDFVTTEMRNMSLTSHAYDVSEGGGWSDDGRDFVVGKIMYREGKQPVPVQLKEETKSSAEHIKTRGAIAAWRSAVDVFAVPGSESAQLAILSSFAAPLLKFTECPGFTIHLASQGSGCGKTTIQKTAASIWGDPNHMLMGKDDTYNARIQKIGAARHLPAFMDEVTGLDSNKVSELIYAIAQGKEKSRLAGARHTVNEGVSWRTIVLTSANDSLRAKIGATRGYAEAENMRMFELQLPRLSTRNFIHNSVMIQQIGENYGLAGVTYAQWLVENRHMVAASVAQNMRMLFEKHRGQASERYWFQVLACIVTAGELAASAGLHGFDMTAFQAWIGSVFLPSQRMATSQQLSEGEGMLGDFLHDHATATIVVRASRRDQDEEEATFLIKRPTSPKIGIRRELGPNHTIISLDSIKQWCEKKYISPTHFMDQVKKSDVFIIYERTQRDLGAGIDEYATGGKGAWCLVIDMRKLTTKDDQS